MTRTGLLIAFLLAAVTVAAPRPGSAQTVGEIARSQSRAVVVIETLDVRGTLVSQGSGFIVTPSGAIVTSLHVLRGGASIRVRLANGDTYLTTEVVDVDELKDIAIVRIKGYGLPFVSPGDSENTEVGAEVIVISSPEGLTNTVSTGIVSGVRKLDTHRVFQITAPISQGSSGGALFNTRGEVIGIATYLLKSGQNINFAIPINYARGLISDTVTTTIATLNGRIESMKSVASDGADPPGAPAAERRGAAAAGVSSLGDQISNAARAKRGRTALDPMFPRPDEALALFYRFVDGIGLLTAADIDNLTRTADVRKTPDSYTIRFLSYQYGVTLSFSSPERILTSVDMLVNWSVENLRHTFGDKFKRRMVDNLKIIDYGRLETGRSLVAILDSNGNVQTIRFTIPPK
ncbi:MAG: S1C family serine protease [Blastocatellia bacterium]